MGKGVPYWNIEGYSDRTAAVAMNRIIREEKRRKNLNSWSGIGAIVKDPKMDKGKTGEYSLRLVMAIQRRKTETYDYISVRLGPKLATEYQGKVVKGDVIGVNGRLQTWTYTPEDGIKRYGYEILADEVIQMGK